MPHLKNLGLPQGGKTWANNAQKSVMKVHSASPVLVWRQSQHALLMCHNHMPSSSDTLLKLQIHFALRPQLGIHTLRRDTKGSPDFWDMKTYIYSVLRWNDFQCFGVSATELTHGMFWSCMFCHYLKHTWWFTLFNFSNWICCQFTLHRIL